MARRELKMSETTKILKLKDIAYWWLPEQMKDEVPETLAALPSIQRGFVWGTDQIELLWDSIAQGFPLGSLLLTKYDTNLRESTNTTSGQGNDGELENPEYLILDGQQRATAIALGFRDIWSTPQYEVKEALWVDLVKLNKEERKFSFRVVTKAHPWGYKRTNPKSRLNAYMAREALKQYQELSVRKNVKPHELDLYQVFPWDAEAPVPLALLVNTICNHLSNDGMNDALYVEIREEFSQRLKSSYWNNLSETKIDKFRKVEDILNGKNDDGLRELVYGLRNALQNTEVPAPVLTVYEYHKNGSESNVSDENVPIFNLFKRINNGGTALGREEINYSLLKSVWPEAKEAIEGGNGLLGGRQLAHPARMVSLITRLFIMLESEGSNSRNIEPELNISQFSARLKEVEFRSGLESFCRGKGKTIVGNTWEMLVNGNSALPVVLAARLSQQADDLLLLLMYWLSKINVEPDKAVKKRTLGFIVAVSWFAEDLNQCVKKLTLELLQLINDNAHIVDFFNNKRFQSILERDKNGHVLMRPLPHPDSLCFELNKTITEHPDFRLINRESALWKSERLWQHFHGTDGENTPASMMQFFASHLKANEKDDKLQISNVWWGFLDKVLNDRRFLLYAQRSFIQKNYSWFDPTLPDQIRDHNRPWDYDHILPYSWAHHTTRLKSEISYLVRLWVNVNGNFRVWPLELNRSKGNHEVIEEKVEEYGLLKIEDVCDASFIKDNGAIWSEIEGKVHEGNAPDNEKRKHFWEQGKHWNLFIEASIDRSADIYKEWYDNLSISDLMKK